MLLVTKDRIASYLRAKKFVKSSYIGKIYGLEPCGVIIGSFRFDYEYDYEYEIRQAKRMLYAYAIPY